MTSRLRLFLIGLLATCAPAAAQVFVSALGGSAALSGASVIRATPLAAANYDPKVGPAAQLAIGYHFNDWISAQTGYSWNRNQLTTRQLTGTAFSQSDAVSAQHAVAFEAMLYFRPRASRLRPYLSAGPSIVSVLSERTAGLRVAVGIDISLRGGWGLRYNFSEMASANPFARALNPPAGGKLMNFQNLFGVVKRF